MRCSRINVLYRPLNILFAFYTSCGNISLPRQSTYRPAGSCTGEMDLGIRERLNDVPGLTAGAIVAVLIVLGVVIYRQTRSDVADLPAEGPQAYFSDDDGKTVFRDDPNKLPPFEHKGKQAVSAFVIPSDDGTNTVRYLQRYTPVGKELKAHPKASA